MMQLRAWLIRLLAAAVIGFTVVFLIASSRRDSLLVEDGPIETATAIVFAVAVVLGVVSARRDTDRTRWAVPGFAAIGLLDELSFGARLFGFATPTIGGVEFDSLHDVVDLGDHVLAELGIGRTMAAALLVAVSLAVLAALVRSGRAMPLWRWLTARPHLVGIGIALALLGAAVTADQLSAATASRFVEETLEFIAAGVVAVVAIAEPIRVEQGVRR